MCSRCPAGDWSPDPLENGLPLPCLPLRIQMCRDRDLPPQIRAMQASQAAAAAAAAAAATAGESHGADEAEAGSDNDGAGEGREGEGGGGSSTDSTWVQQMQMRAPGAALLPATTLSNASPLLTSTTPVGASSGISGEWRSD